MSFRHQASPLSGIEEVLAGALCREAHSGAGSMVASRSSRRTLSTSSCRRTESPESSSLAAANGAVSARQLSRVHRPRRCAYGRRCRGGSVEDVPALLSSCFANEIGLTRSDPAVSLDMTYHLVEDEELDSYMHDLFGCATPFVIVYSSDSASLISPTTPRHISHRAITS